MSHDQPTRTSMEESGYSFSNKGKCIGCQSEVEWWWTPAGKKAPMNPMDGPDSPAISHFATCPQAEQFRRKKDAG